MDFSLSVLALGLASVTRKIATSKKVLLFVTLLSMHAETASVYSEIGTVQRKGTVHITNEHANHSCTQCEEKKSYTAAHYCPGLANQNGLNTPFLAFWPGRSLAPRRCRTEQIASSRSLRGKLAGGVGR